MDSKQNTEWYVATRYDVRRGDITFESCVIMNPWDPNTVVDQKHCATHITTVMNIFLAVSVP